MIKDLMYFLSLKTIDYNFNNVLGWWQQLNWPAIRISYLIQMDEHFEWPEPYDPRFTFFPPLVYTCTERKRKGVPHCSTFNI